MAAIILLICFIGIFLCLGSSAKITGIKELLIASALLFSTILVAITEMLSLFDRLNYYFVLMSWLFVAILLILYLYLNKERALLFIAGLKTAIREKTSRLTKTDRTVLGLSALLLLLVLMQGMLYPPNNYDSMTYHMARITSWVSHQSVRHYPTAIIRQLYQPPFAEYVIMHLDMLSRTDLFSNNVQFVFLLLTLSVILSIVELLGLGHTYKLMALVLCITIPEVILQASSTQNDVVNAFFILTAFLFTIKSFNQPCFKNYLLIGLAAGLALLTKGTAYIYLPPILLLLAVISLIQLIKYKRYAGLWQGCIAILLMVSLNSGHYTRNYQLTHNLLGIDKAESNMYANQKMSIGYLFSNLLKNAGLHTGIMFIKPAAIFSNRVIDKLHQISGIKVNDPSTNYMNMPYTAVAPINSEDSAPNPFHLLLTAVSVLLIIYHSIKGRGHLSVTCLLLVLVAQTLFFCFYLKWQPWHSRLHIPLFLISVPLICYSLSLSARFRKITYGLIYVMGIYALITVLHNDNRSYSGAIFENRYQKYFTGVAAWYPEYQAVTQNIQQANYTVVGLISGTDNWEYPLFPRCFSQTVHPVYIAVNNFSKYARPENLKIECIISTITNKPFIDFAGRRYKNKTAANKALWLYE